MPTYLNENKKRVLAERIIQATKLPAQIQELRNKQKETIQKIAQSHVPADFTKETKDIKSEYLCATASIYVDNKIDLNPIHSSEWDEKHAYYTSFTIEPIRIPYCFNFPRIGIKAVPKQYLVNSDKLAKLLTERNELSNQLMAAMHPYKTAEKLIKDYPEFEKHVVIEGRNYAVTVSPTKTIVALMKHGFDITVPKTKAKSKSKTKAATPTPIEPGTTVISL